MIHAQKSSLAGVQVTISGGRFAGSEFLVEDWWDRIAGRSWMDCDGNPACLDYAMGELSAPIDNEVLYGKIGSLGKLVHVSHVTQSNGLAQAQ